MMQSCASAAKLRAAGPFYRSASVPGSNPVPSSGESGELGSRSMRRRRARLGNGDLISISAIPQFDSAVMLGPALSFNISVTGQAVALSRATPWAHHLLKGKLPGKGRIATLRPGRSSSAIAQIITKCAPNQPSRASTTLRFASRTVC